MAPFNEPESMVELSGRVRLPAQTDNHVDMGDFHAFGGLWQTMNRQVARRYVHHLIVTLNKEMVMVRYVGIKIGLGRFDSQHPQHAGIGKLMQRIVYGGQRNRLPCRNGLFVQFFSSQMPVALGKQQAGQGNALARWTQPG